MKTAGTVVLILLLGGCGLRSDPGGQAASFANLSAPSGATSTEPAPAAAAWLPAANAAGGVTLVDGRSAPYTPAESVGLQGLADQEEEAADGPSEDAWEFIVRPYLWMASVSGSLEADGDKSRFSASFGDILDDLDFGIMGNFEARTEDYALLLDGLYLHVSASAGSGANRVKSSLKTFMGEFDVLVPVHEDVVQRVELLGGVRYWYYKVKVRPQGIPNGEASTDWIDPVVGARYALFFAEDWTLLGRADIGGFGIGSASDSTYQLGALTEYRVTEAFRAGFGWRYLALDNDNHGSTDIHLRMNGPIVGLSFRF